MDWDDDSWDLRRALGARWDVYKGRRLRFGLVLNAAPGWWWADPLAGYVLVVYAVGEAREIFQHSNAPASLPTLTPPSTNGCAPGRR
jgi:hypothetical protein